MGICFESVQTRRWPAEPMYQQLTAEIDYAEAIACVSDVLEMMSDAIVQTADNSRPHVDPRTWETTAVSEVILKVSK